MIVSLTDEDKMFIREHKSDDLNALLLSASRYPNMDIPFLVKQIASRRQIKDKLPSWYAQEDLVFPAKITVEQCSSELTALYKQRLIRKGDQVCDLTGGLGVDSFFLSQKAGELIYMERFPSYCEAAQLNFRILGADNIRICPVCDSVAALDTRSQDMDVFYIDPARRGEGDKRVYALQDCEPDLTVLAPKLIERASRVIAKISPMADIHHTLELLPKVTQVHILSVGNECKELLFVMSPVEVYEHLPITCVNFTASGTKTELYEFTYERERELSVEEASSVGLYLYEPNSSVMKAGAFKCIAADLGVKPLQVNSHLYTSDVYLGDFPGRSFRVDKVYPFNNKLCKTIGKEIPKANIAVRNFPISVHELRKKCQIKDGGDYYLFATTLSDGEKVLIGGYRC